MNLNVNICDKAKFIKANFSYYDNNEKDNLDREKKKNKEKGIKKLIKSLRLSYWQ